MLAAATTSRVRVAEIELNPFSLEATVDSQLLGRFDPTGRRTRGSFTKVHLHSDGTPVAWRFTRTDAGMRVEAEGAPSELFAAVVAQFPLGDGIEHFAAHHDAIRSVSRVGLRLMRVPWIFDVAAGAVLQQRVRWQVAYSDFRRIAERYGVRGRGWSAFPNAARLAAVQPYELEAFGIDAKRARALTSLARAETTRSLLTFDADPVRLERRLCSLPGIGPWTANHITGFAYGAPDAVPTGDLHLPSLVSSALAGEPEGTDARMLELLEPYRGQRFRVIRLLSWSWRRFIRPSAARP